ncbi:CatB-related O-acetyltransferase [bacterium]|nr:CatB-related O-acetyltransferase [bacterium]
MQIKFMQKMIDIFRNKKQEAVCQENENAKIYPPYNIGDTKIGKGTYIAPNSTIHNTTIGKYCSIGPNLICGYGIHPLNGISTAPCFYSTKKQNGMTYSKEDKIEETLPIIIGNDVFIGMNVSILDGVKIGDGAVIAAGAVVTKDVPPYAVIGGVPAKVIKYRFSEDVVEKLLKIKWWNWDDKKLQEVERMFFSVEDFVKKYEVK